MARHRVVDHIVGYLASIGVDYIFGVDGANIEDLYDAKRREIPDNVVDNSMPGHLSPVLCARRAAS